MSNEARTYEILGVLGEGGFGKVYRARFQGEGGFRKEVALKVLRADLEHSEELASRLRDEARILGLLRHRSIVAVDRLTMVDGQWTIVMEYVDGCDLTRAVERGPMPAGPALEIAAEIAGALHVAWSKPGDDGKPLCLLHRDLKPSNVRLTPYAEVKVLDFGISRAEFSGREAKTRSLAFGTPEYMAPERLDFFSDGPRSDVYSLGAVLYELLTGSQVGRTFAHPVRHERTLERAREGLVAVSAPAPVVELIMRLLAFEPDDRPSASELARSAAELARRLGQPSLRSWIDEHEASLFGAVSAAPADPTGATLVEQRPPPSAPDRPFDLTPPRPTPPAVALPEPPAPEPSPPAPVVPAISPPRATTTTPAPVPAPRRQVTPAPTERPGRGGLWAAIGLGLAVALAIVAVGLLWILREPPAGDPVGQPSAEASPAPQPPAPTTAPTATAPTVAPTPPPPPSSTNAQPGQPSAPKATPTTARSPQPEPTKAAPSSASATGASTAQKTTTPTSAPATPTRARSSTHASVRVEGDAEQVWLRIGANSYPTTGDVPPGTYSIFARFSDAGAIQVGSATLEAGKAYVIRCSSQFEKCTATAD